MLNGDIQLLKAKLEHDDIYIVVQRLKHDISILQYENKNVEKRLNEIEIESDEESDDVDSEPEYNMQESISYFKCDVCEYECQREVTIYKHKNTKHNPKSRLGPGTFWVFNICKKRQA